MGVEAMNLITKIGLLVWVGGVLAILGVVAFFLITFTYAVFTKDSPLIFQIFIVGMDAVMFGTVLIEGWKFWEAMKP